MLGNLKYLVVNLSKSTLSIVLSTLLLMPVLVGLNKSAIAAEMGVNNSINNTLSDSNLLLLAHKTRRSAGVYSSTGQASWYGSYFHGRTTANGERYNMYGISAAHKTLAFGTRVKVTNLNNGKSVIVRINDRGPYSGGRIIDLSMGAAQAIGMISSGVAPVRIQVVR